MDELSEGRHKGYLKTQKSTQPIETPLHFSFYFTIEH